MCANMVVEVPAIREETDTDTGYVTVTSPVRTQDLALPMR